MIDIITSAYGIELILALLAGIFITLGLRQYKSRLQSERQLDSLQEIQEAELTALDLPRYDSSSNADSVDSKALRQSSSASLSSIAVTEDRPPAVIIPKKTHLITISKSINTPEASIKRFRAAGMQNLFHFTHLDNIESIQKNGICSIQELIKRGIQCNYHLSDDSSRSIDVHKELDVCVNLAFHPRYSMVYKASERVDGKIAMWVINIDVLTLPGIEFTRGLANANDMIREPISCLMEEDLKEFMNDYGRSGKWQILVPDHVPARYLVRHELWRK
jgi:hypothetical protein